MQPGTWSIDPAVRKVLGSCDAVFCSEWCSPGIIDAMHRYSQSALNRNNPQTGPLPPSCPLVLFLPTCTRHAGNPDVPPAVTVTDHLPPPPHGALTSGTSAPALYTTVQLSPEGIECVFMLSLSPKVKRITLHASSAAAVCKPLLPPPLPPPLAADCYC